MKTLFTFAFFVALAFVVPTHPPKLAMFLPTHPPIAFVVPTHPPIA